MVIAEKSVVQEVSYGVEIRRMLSEEMERESNLPAACLLVARRITEDGWVTGPLWAEIGPQIIRQFWVGSGGVVHLSHSTVGRPQATGRIYAEWYCVGEKGYVQLGDMNRADCRIVMEQYHKLAKVNREKGLFFEKLVEGMKEKDLVRTRYTAEEIAAIRERVSVTE